MKKTWIMALAVFPVAQSAHAEIIIGPRVSYYFDNSNVRISNDDGTTVPTLEPEVKAALEQSLQTEVNFSGEENDASRGDQLTFPMFGGAISAGDDRDRFTLTAMLGSGEGSTVQTLVTSNRLTYADQLITDLRVIEIDSPLLVDRYDVELTWQRRVSEQLAIFGGVRFERLDISSSTTVTSDETSNIRNFIETTLGTGPSVPDIFEISNFQIDTKIETYSARVGVTAFVPVDQSITAFFNGMVHGSHQPANTVRQRLIAPNATTLNFKGSSETSLGPDIAVGMQLGLAENISMDVRYRAIFFFPVAGGLSFDQARVNHGINMGLSFRL